MGFTQQLEELPGVNAMPTTRGGLSGRSRDEREDNMMHKRSVDGLRTYRARL